MSDERKQEEKGLSGLANIVPTAYYDLIARICPGVAFWVALSFKSPIFGNFAATKDLSGASLFILILLSYLTGIVLTGFCWIWDYVCFWIFTLSNSFSKQLELLPKAEASFIEQWAKISLQMDEVAMVSDEAGKTLVKNLAEVTMCENLLTGIIVLTALGIVSNASWFYSIFEIPWEFGLVAVSLLLSVIFRQVMFVGRVKLAHKTHCQTESCRKPEGDRT